ncbi:hypothetical protein [Acinetobacter tianfuensis]|uniref:Uncharacterized protein n=1 Tax=Acinetobacter tianfuensis TaxID=2419603 RepID=A0A3A8E4Q8_9GAMM|nr:hypothetical protein [Acinetobacter tianfuensis]RKG29897.1 hypothetical protein D7V32_13155 [Acinetobacter tianfuensis]
MLKFLLLLCFAIVILALWMTVRKIVITQRYAAKFHQAKAPLKKPSVSEQQPEREIELESCIVDEYEQQLFDDIAALFFQQDHIVKSAEAAVELQEKILQKMPVTSKTQIRHLDLDEHSIYWSFYDQSLEYYMGKYGMFYTHVDRFGAEHKKEICYSQAS